MRERGWAVIIYGMAVMIAAALVGHFAMPFLAVVGGAAAPIGAAIGRWVEDGPRAKGVR